MGYGAETNNPTTSAVSTSATDFASVSRILVDTTAQFGGTSPGFRSPPRIPGVKRSVTRNRDGSVTVAVAVRDRPVMAVIADMIDGVILTSGGAGDGELYDALWTAAQRWVHSARSDTAPHHRHLRVAA